LLSACGFQPRRPFEDIYEHRARFTALRRSIRQPQGRRVRRQNVLEVTVALDAARRELGNVEISAPLVAMLDEQPAPTLA